MAGPQPTGGKPQAPSGTKTVQVAAHTRTIPVRQQLVNRGLTRGQASYQVAHHPGAGARQILKARAQQIRQNNPNFYGQGANLSPRQANSLSQNAAQIKYGPALSIDRQQVANIPGWFQGYQNQVAQLQQAQQAATQGLVGGINNAQGQLATQQQTSQNAALRAMGQDAATRGATVDPSLAATSSQFQTGLNALSASDAARAQALGQSEQNYLQNLGLIQQAAGQRAQTAAQNKLSQDTQLSGAYANTVKQQLIANAQKVGIENATLNLNSQKANQSFQLGSQKLRLANRVAGNNNANAKARINATIRGQNINASLRRDAQNMTRAQFMAKYGISPGDALKGAKPLRGLKGSGAGGLTPTQVRSYAKLRDKAISIMQLDPKKPSATNPGSVAQWSNQLTAKLNVPHDLAVGIVDQFVYGGVDQKTANHLFKVYGIHLKVGPKPGGGALAEPNT